MNDYIVFYMRSERLVCLLKVTADIQTYFEIVHWVYLDIGFVCAGH